MLTIMLTVLGALSGCASTLAPHNVPIGGKSGGQGYRDSLTRPRQGMDSIIFGVSFSGGGSRAAALAYGVLEELAHTTVPVRGEPRRMLDLVETISAVSGGSYTAAYYGLFGDRLFQDFEKKFLKRDVQKEIVSTIFTPSNLISMTSPYYGRSDVLAEFLDQRLFEGKTFADLEHAVHQEGRPFILINSTDMGRTSRFEFTQDQFDLLCSDLGPYKVSRAVAASSAVPVVFSPITLSNYADRCKHAHPELLSPSLNERRESIRRFTLTTDLNSYLDSGKRKYIHLLDGGLSDNLGLRAALDRLSLLGASQMADAYRRPSIRRLVHIVVNAQVHADYPQLDQFAEVPTLSAIAYTIGNTTDRFNIETLAHFRSSIDQAVSELAKKQSAAGIPNGDDVQAMMIEISFDSLESEEERAYFNALPTSFNLPPEAIDRLREVGARMLRTSPEFQRLLREIPTLD
ncbi:patatin-like phospholipase family protein [Niveibacterium terrae]|uniref:patatin-like phospholipase family protein n=1 Tax=Niveibacterium terrae TaxID=3373598 RepID=UPI003A9246E1